MLRAIDHRSNDFVTLPGIDMGIVVAVPAPVVAAIDSIARAELDSICTPQEECGAMAIDGFYGDIAFIAMPNGDDLYVFNEPQPFVGRFFLIVFRQHTQTAVTQPYTIEMEETEMVWHPTVVFQDLEGNGVQSIGLEETFHEGTDDTGWRYRYFSIDTADHFHPIITTESSWADSVDESVLIDSPREEDARIIRRLTFVSPDRLRLDSRLGRPDRPPVELGYAILVRTGPGRPFRVVERHPRKRRYNHFLLTFDGIAAEKDLLSLWNH